MNIKYKQIKTSRFKKEYKLAIKRGYKIEKLDDIIRSLVCGEELSESLRDHELKGKWLGHRELHIESDWLLIYQIIENALVLELTRTGSHADLFGK